MSDDRETPASRAAEAPETSANPGAPVEETEASQTEVLAAVERSKGATSDADEGEAKRELVVVEETVVADPAADDALADDATAAEQARRQEASEVDTQLDLDLQSGSRPAAEATDFAVLPALDDLPSAAADAQLSPERDGEIRISPDHPMAALYMQTPMPPEIRGNRGAGVLIALLATVGFVLLYAGVIALWLAPTLAPSQFVDGLTAELVSWSTAAAAGAFFVGLAVLVLIVGRAGWWAYVLGSFLVGLVVWMAATAGLLVDEAGFRALLNIAPVAIAERFGLTIPAIVAGLAAREAAIWFGAWIGGRGRRMKQRNAVALAEYEAALAEVQEKHSKPEQPIAVSKPEKPRKRAKQS
ncbi:hypothetical protein H490_0114125 [Leucobacter sp. UCD-THU]|uniref:hypothetical protein n=1 Tax=Leucobacter sp. UCD-THU TaxID=1292023 RepID=UPI000363A4C5|nr:hypothetical protein [Leucobacter sp. UCD-THU]EYT52120.1 hypothetical protein H490_0114125 [Leucobacter sp. UCD-THU]